MVQRADLEIRENVAHLFLIEKRHDTALNRGGDAWNIVGSIAKSLGSFRSID